MTLDDLIGLNDEIAALVRAGVPLDQGLGELGADMPGRLGQAATTIAARTARGESLVDVLGDPAAGFPPIYRAVVEAGLRVGRLPAALESLATSIRRMTETRRSIMTACLYPLLLLILACGFFAFFSTKIAPTMSSAFEAFRVPGRAVLAVFTVLGQWAWLWGAMIPAGVVVLAFLWWDQTRRTTLLGSSRTGYLLQCFPWIGETLRCSRAATFADLLALLVEHDVPLGEAFTLAANACGDRRLIGAAKDFARSLDRGATVAQADGLHAAVPPLLRWLMASGQKQCILLPALRHAAQTYHRRAQYRADVARTLLPVLLMLVAGGSVTLAYALTLFLPYTSLLRTLGG
jgi:type II secretory pathway component PulF